MKKSWKISIPEDKRAEVQQMLEKTGCTTPLELLSHAFGLLNWCIEQSEKGRIIVSADEVEGNYVKARVEGVMDILDRVARRSPRQGTYRDRIK